jgi:hypothetical protein
MIRRLGAGPKSPVFTGPPILRSWTGLPRSASSSPADAAFRRVVSVARSAMRELGGQIRPSRRRRRCPADGPLQILRAGRLERIRAGHDVIQQHAER